MGEPVEVRDAFNEASDFLSPVLNRGMQTPSVLSFDTQLTVVKRRLKRPKENRCWRISVGMMILYPVVMR